MKSITKEQAIPLRIYDQMTAEKRFNTPGKRAAASRASRRTDV